MAYAAQSDLCPLRLSEEDLAELTDDSGAVPPVVNAAIVTAALEEASGKIDSYCRSRYQTPLQQCDDVVSLCIDLAAFILFARRRNLKPDDIVSVRKNDAMRMLEGIAAGKINLDLPAAATPQTPVIGPQVSCKPQRFDERNLEGFC